MRVVYQALEKYLTTCRENAEITILGLLEQEKTDIFTINHYYMDTVNKIKSTVLVYNRNCSANQNVNDIEGIFFFLHYCHES